MTIYKIGLFADLHDVEGSKSETLGGIYKAFTDNGASEAIALGDLIDYHVAGWVEDMIARFALPTSWVVGNHDEYQGRFAAEIGNYQAKETSSCDFRRDYGNWTILGINTAYGDVITVSIPQGTLDWVASQLATCRGRYVVIISHAPITPVPNDAMMGYLFPPNYSILLNIINNAVASGVNIPLYLFGHGHNSTYSYPAYVSDNGVVFFEIDNSSDGVNAGVLELAENGSWSIKGIGTQKPMQGMAGNKPTYHIDQDTGSDSGDSTAPKKTIAGLYAVLVTNLAKGDRVILPKAIDWTGGSGSVINYQGYSTVAIDDFIFSGSFSSNISTICVTVEEIQ